VHARAFDLNVFPLPRRLIDAVLGSPAFEVVLLRLADRPREATGSDIVAFAVQHVTDEQVVPLFVGLDYTYVPTHSSYQVLLLQALRSAQRRGAHRVRFGMGADLHKARFGARREKRWAYVQASDTYNADLLARLAETVPAS
jgi:CelD/BcsL family acetyltransferase involved in cellulose biosynthesis